MGSEGPSRVDGEAAVIIHVTGFKKFHGVAENPTQTIVSNLNDYVAKRGGLSNGARLGSCTVIDTAGQGSLASLYALFQQQQQQSSSSISQTHHQHQQRLVWLHLGVNSGANKFAVECRAINEATFRCPDEMGWQPQKSPIIPEDGNILHSRETVLRTKDIVQALQKQGYDVVLSDDAGRFVCNYVYYHSLRYAANHGAKSLFVHVPLFSKIEEECQMQFVASLLEVLASVG